MSWKEVFYFWEYMNMRRVSEGHDFLEKILLGIFKEKHER